MAHARDIARKEESLRNLGLQYDSGMGVGCCGLLPRRPDQLQCGKFSAFTALQDLSTTCVHCMIDGQEHFFGSTTNEFYETETPNYVCNDIPVTLYTNPCAMHAPANWQEHTADRVGVNSLATRARANDCFVSGFFLSLLGCDRNALRRPSKSVIRLWANKAVLERAWLTLQPLLSKPGSTNCRPEIIGNVGVQLRSLGFSENQLQKFTELHTYIAFLQMNSQLLLCVGSDPSAELEVAKNCVKAPSFALQLKDKKAKLALLDSSDGKDPPPTPPVAPTNFGNMPSDAEKAGTTFVEAAPHSLLIQEDREVSNSAYTKREFIDPILLAALPGFTLLTKDDVFKLTAEPLKDRRDNRKRDLAQALADFGFTEHAKQYQKMAFHNLVFSRNPGLPMHGDDAVQGARCYAADNNTENFVYGMVKRHFKEDDIIGKIAPGVMKFFDSFSDTASSALISAMVTSEICQCLCTAVMVDNELLKSNTWTANRWKENFSKNVVKYACKNDIEAISTAADKNKWFNIRRTGAVKTNESLPTERPRCLISSGDEGVVVHNYDAGIGGKILFHLPLFRASCTKYCNNAQFCTRMGNFIMRFPDGFCGSMDFGAFDGSLAIGFRDAVENRVVLRLQAIILTEMLLASIAVQDRRKLLKTISYKNLVLMIEKTIRRESGDRGTTEWNFVSNHFAAGMVFFLELLFRAGLIEMIFAQRDGEMVCVDIRDTCGGLLMNWDGDASKICQHGPEARSKLNAFLRIRSKVIKWIATVDEEGDEARAEFDVLKEGDDGAQFFSFKFVTEGAEFGPCGKSFGERWCMWYSLLGFKLEPQGPNGEIAKADLPSYAIWPVRKRIEFTSKIYVYNVEGDSIHVSFMPKPRKTVTNGFVSFAKGETFADAGYTKFLSYCQNSTMCPTLFLLFHMMARDFNSLGGKAKRGALDAYTADKIFKDETPVLLEDTYCEYSKFIVNIDRVAAMRNAFARESGIAVEKQHDWERLFMSAQPGEAAIAYTKFAEQLKIIQPAPGAILVHAEGIELTVSEIAPNNPSPLAPNCMMPGELAGHQASGHDDTVQKITADKPILHPTSSRSSETITSGLISTPVSHVSGDQLTPAGENADDRVIHAETPDQVATFAGLLTRNLIEIQDQEGREQQAFDWLMQNYAVPSPPPGFENAVQQAPPRPTAPIGTVDADLTPNHTLRDHAPPTPAEGGGSMNTYGSNGPTGLSLRADVACPIVLYGDALGAQMSNKLEHALQRRRTKFGDEPKPCDRYHSKALFCLWVPWCMPDRPMQYRVPSASQRRIDALNFELPYEMCWLHANYGDEKSNRVNDIIGGIWQRPEYMGSTMRYFERRLSRYPSYYDPWTSTDYFRKNNILTPELKAVIDDHRLLQALLLSGVYYDGPPDIADLQ
jgi:hypothetical protein